MSAMPKGLRTADDELYRGEAVTIISPLWTPHPVFHVLDYLEELRPHQRENLDIPDSCRATGITTRCGRLLRATWWLDSPGYRTAFSDEWAIDRTLADLRFDHARLFARPCLRCWPDTPRLT